jgi:hypothetical protein
VRPPIWEKCADTSSGSSVSSASLRSSNRSLVCRRCSRSTCDRIYRSWSRLRRNILICLARSSLLSCSSSSRAQTVSCPLTGKDTWRLTCLRAILLPRICRQSERRPRGPFQVYPSCYAYRPDPGGRANLPGIQLLQSRESQKLPQGSSAIRPAPSYYRMRSIRLCSRSRTLPVPKWSYQLYRDLRSKGQLRANTSSHWGFARCRLR